jgi:hypothetical protein
MKKIIYPENKDFIFTIFDDTDVATVENIRPVYDYLFSLGMLTTKTVWPLKCLHKNSDFAGSHTLQNKVYAKYIKKLADRGFEIAFHGASMESCTREKTIEGVDYFYNTLGFFPKTYACHVGNLENIYWGKDRFTFFLFKLLYNFLNYKSKNYYYGNKAGSNYFWADICEKYFKYVRTFTFYNINLLNISDKLPYSTPLRPHFKSCFFSSDAENVEEFNNLISLKNQEKLVRERGICIVSTHFGKGFVKNGELNKNTKALLERLSSRNGLFAPVSEILDHLKLKRRNLTISRFQLFILEFKWMVHAIKRRKNRKKYEKTEISYLNTA